MDTEETVSPESKEQQQQAPNKKVVLCYITVGRKLEERPTKNVSLMEIYCRAHQFLENLKSYPECEEGFMMSALYAARERFKEISPKCTKSLLFVVMCHGKKGTGNFCTTVPFASGANKDGLLTINPESFWNGIDKTAWPGMLSLIETLPKDSDSLPNNGFPIHILFAQCYGLKL